MLPFLCLMRIDVRLILAHVAGWLLFFSFILIFVSSNNRGQPLSSLIATKEFWFFAATFIFLFYLNSRLLFPHLYLKQHYALYFLLFVLLFVAVYYVRPVDKLIHNEAALSFTSTLSFGESLPRNDIGSPGFKRGPELDILSLLLFVLVWALGTAFQIMKQWQSVQEKAAIAEAERVHAELSFLKAQINPHFLFNTLNNIYSLAVHNSDKTPNAIMKLSKIMRYVTDEAMLHFVQLKSEVEFMSDYIELQKLRLSNKVNLDFSVKGNVEDKQIAPLILMPFIENVFKYGISSHKESDIKIELCANDTGIRFFCQNKIFAKARYTDSTGVGIENTKRRLDLFYNGNYLLSINRDNGIYTVQLELQV